ncbi:thiosulfate/3-mercaptopyruvate sulfurtransferase [Rhizobiales bacterium GAS113]|nr:thiosulfate/3-mercaptopyruvate sulfurtransferase [Rhizobiales bacterium GAS113]
MPKNLVSTDWLGENLKAPDLAVIDGSWYLPALNRDGKAEYLTAHIPGAVHFDIEEISDHFSPLPHMIPTPEQFARQMGELGIGDRMTLVVYDGAGLGSAPRVWWMLRVFGARDVRILDGGLPKWLSEGRPTEAGLVKRAAASFTTHFNASAVADRARVSEALETGKAQVIDARSAERFTGAAPEIRPGLRSGHMPGALNAPSSTLLEKGRLKSPSELARLLDDAGLDRDRPVITSCGSGVTAAIISLALDELGRPAEGLYDGSWTEWASTAGSPIVTGPA